MKNLKQELESRGFLHQYTHEEAFEKFDLWWEKFYFWVDCSANSMTIGNFVALQMAIHFMLKWNKCFLLVGWATSTIWNPWWKDKERPILSEEDLVKNQAGITKQFDLLIKNVENITWKKLDYEIVNNYDFFKNMNVLDFLKEVWRFMTVNWMMWKDIVKKRIEDPKQWISYAEFSYMLIMWYDFYYLNKNKWVTLEVGWSDEWDGILSWIELVSKKTWKEVYGVTNKLIMDANWKKFGKSEWNAIWLDKNKSTPYFMYQYFMNTLDWDIDRFLKLFSFLPEEEISEIVKNHMLEPEKREWQKTLAYKVVEIIHWENESKLAEKISDFMFWNPSSRIETLEKLNKEELKTFKNAIWWIKYSWENLFETLVKSELEKSNSWARNSIKSGAIFINEKKVEDFNLDLEKEFLENGSLLLRKWKKNFKIVEK